MSGMPVKWAAPGIPGHNQSLVMSSFLNLSSQIHGRLEVNINIICKHDLVQIIML